MRARPAQVVEYQRVTKIKGYKKNPLRRGGQGWADPYLDRNYFAFNYRPFDGFGSYKIFHIEIDNRVEN